MKRGPIQKKINTTDEKIDKLVSKFDGLESKLDGMESKLDGLESRFNGLESTVDDLAIMMAKGFNSLQTEMNARFAMVDDSFVAVRRDILGLHDKFDDLSLRTTTLEKKVFNA